MNAAELVSEMRSRGVSVYLDGGRLRCSGPPGAVTEEIRRALTTHKADIAAALSQPPRRASLAIQPTSGSGSPPRMSYAQKRLWFLDRLDPRSASYNIALALRLIGELDRGAFEAALDEIVHRHDVLRSSFVERDGEPIQVIRASLKIETPVVDLAGVEASRREAEARRLLREEASRPFDLAEDPLLRWLVINLGRNEAREPEHIVALTLHHIVSDGWSTAVLTREFAILYEAFAAGRASPLPPLSLQYADYAAWQQEWLRGEMLERQLAYWRNELSGALSVLELPTDRPRPRRQDHSGATRRFVVNEKTTRALRTFGREENATLFMTLLAAFQILLARHSGQTDICVGSPVANRRLVELEELIGCFVNTLVLRGDVSGNPSFRDFLARVRETALGAQEHQDVPFERLVEELQPQRDPSRSPLFQALFVLQNAPASELKLSGLRIEPIAASSGATKFDLSLSVIEHDGQLFAQFDYATALFDAETIAGLADRYVALLAGIVADPLCRLGDLPMLDADELRRVLFAWNAARQDGPSDMCVHELFEKQATLTPDADAVVFEGACLTYRELNVRANRLAHRLVAAKVGAETVVGLCVERSLEMVVGLLAVLKSGGAYLPLDPDYPSERLAHLIEDARPTLVLTPARLRSRLPETVPVLELDVDPASGGAEDEVAPTRRAGPDNLAYVIYTSGSTGRPKGVAVVHRGLANYTCALNERFGEKGLRFVMASTLAADLGNTSLFPSLTTGGCLHILSYETATDAKAMADYMETHAIDVLKIVPSHYAALTHSKDRRLQPRRALVFGGEVLSFEVARQAISRGGEVRVFNHYGPTETTIGALMSAVDADAPFASDPPIGRPIRNVQAYLLDANMNPISVGVAGELYIGGAGLARGYLRRPDSTAERFVPNPFGAPGERLYRTGDLARYRTNGAVEFLGRIDQQVKIRGFRVELGEIESAFSRIDGVDSAVATARDGPSGEKRLVAYVITRLGSVLSAADLRKTLERQLPDHMVPAAFVFLDALPLTRNGKVDRKALPAPDIANQRTDANSAPRTVTEWILVREFEQVLNVSPVGVDDDFFRLGGSSLSAVKLVEQIRRTLCSDLPVMAIFQAPTPSRLSSWISGERKEKYAPLVLMRSGGDERPLYCVHPAGGTVVRYQALADSLDGVTSVYGLQSRSVFDPRHLDGSIDDMAATYVDAIRLRQSRGPYHLLGWSMGGAIAVAMAAKLERSGEEVAFLGLLDTHIHSKGSATVERSVLDHLHQFAKLEGVDLSRELQPAHYEKLQDATSQMSDRERFVYAALWGLEQGFWRNVSSDLLEFLYSDAENASKLTRNLRLGVISSPIHVWWARRSLVNGESFPVDWRAFTRGSVTLEIVDGDHDEIVRSTDVHGRVKSILGSLRPTQAGDSQ